MKNLLLLCILIMFFQFNTLQAEEITIVSEHLPPFQIAEPGATVTNEGMAVEVVKALLDLTNRHKSIQIYPWARGYKMALERKNVLIFSLARTKERENQFKWIGMILKQQDFLWSLSSRQDITVNQLDDAKQYITSVPFNDNQYFTLVNQGFEPGKQLYLVSSWKQSISMLFTKRVDLVMGTELSIAYYLRQKQFDISLLKKVFKVPNTSDELYIAFSQSTSDEIVSEFRAAYSKLKQSGQLDNIIKKWQFKLSN